LSGNLKRNLAFGIIPGIARSAAPQQRARIPLWPACPVSPVRRNYDTFTRWQWFSWRTDWPRIL